MSSYHPRVARGRRLLATTAVCFGTIMAASPPARAVVTPRHPTAAGYSVPAFTQVAAAQGQACAVNAEQSVQCWGNDFLHDIEPPAGQYLAVAVSSQFGCALSVDSFARCWGKVEVAQDHVYPPKVPLIAIAAGARFACGLTKAKTIACWGLNALKELQAPAGQFTSISLAGLNGCGIKVSGTIACWGDPRSGVTTAIPSGRFRQISLGDQFDSSVTEFACGVRQDRSMICWGWGGDGQTRPPTGRFLAASAESQSACGLLTTGYTVCWGTTPGALWGAGADPPHIKFTSLASGWQFTCGITAAGGSIDCWGDNNFAETEPPGAPFIQVSGNCGIRRGGWGTCWGSGGGPSPPILQAVRMVQVSDVGAGIGCGIRLAARSVVCWGGDSTDELMHSPAGSFEHISVGDASACGVRKDLTWTCWGQPMARAPNGLFREISVGQANADDFACGLRPTGRLKCWGDPDDFNYKPNGQTDPPAGLFAAVQAGAGGACGLRGDGTMDCWGSGFPTPRGHFASMSGAGGHICGLTSARQVVCPGDSYWHRFRYVAFYDGGQSCGIFLNGSMQCGAPPNGILFPVETP